MSVGSPDAWFESLPTNQKPILVALRRMILAMEKGVVEEFKWGRPVYSTANGIFCYLHTTKKHATLGFYHAGTLKDPKGLLEGTGKDMRHVKVATMGDVDQPAFKALLKQAMAV
jgi:hypothetical protein